MSESAQEWVALRTDEWVLAERLYEIWEHKEGSRIVAQRVAQRVYKNHADQIIADHAAARERDQLRAERDDFIEWLTDQQVVHWTLTDETKDNPKAAVKSLLQTFLREMEDPQISEIAAKAAERDALQSRLAAAEERERVLWVGMDSILYWLDGAKETGSMFYLENIRRIASALNRSRGART